MEQYVLYHSFRTKYEELRYLYPHHIYAIVMPRKSVVRSRTVLETAADTQYADMEIGELAQDDPDGQKKAAISFWVKM